jgi:MFS family permease
MTPSFAATGRTRAGTPQGWSLLVTMTLPVMGVVLLTATLPLLNAHFAGHPYLVAIALTAPGLCIALLSPVAGYLVDRFKRRTVLLSALAVYAACGVAPMALDDIRSVVFTRFGLGVAESMIMTACFALLADYFEDDERGRWLAYLASFIALAATVFYMLGGYLGTMSWRAPFAAYSFSVVVFLVAVFVVFEPKRSGSLEEDAVSVPSARGALLNRRLFGTLAATTVAAILFFIVPLQFAMLLSDNGAQSSFNMGVLLAVAGLGNPLGALAFRWTFRYSTSANLVGAFAISGIGLILAAATKDPAIGTAAAFVNQLGAGLTYPVLMAAAMNQLPPQLRGRGGGLWLSAFFIGQFLSPLVVVRWAMLAGHYSSAYAGLGVVCLVAAAGAAMGLQRANRPIDRRSGA